MLRNLAITILYLPLGKLTYSIDIQTLVALIETFDVVESCLYIFPKLHLAFCQYGERRGLSCSPAGGSKRM